MILQPNVSNWKGSKPNSTGGFRIDVCGRCRCRLPDDFATMTEPYECPHCGTRFEPDRPRPPRRRRRRR